jgi:hypothetical protein
MVSLGLAIDAIRLVDGSLAGRLAMRVRYLQGRWASIEALAWCVCRKLT